MKRAITYHQRCCWTSLFPDNLPSASSCLPCNNGLSPDEDYLACVLECTVAGRVDPAKMERSKVAQIISRSPKLQAQLHSIRNDVEGQIIWKPAIDRISRVLLKLARGHAAHELNEPQIGPPMILWFAPLLTLSSDERISFEGNAAGELTPWPEIGSRSFYRVFDQQDDRDENGWLVVQSGRYRYKTDQTAGLRVRIVIREYLACEVVWD